MRVLVVTNDFPPRIGGINDYVDRMFRPFPVGSVTIVSSRFGDWKAFDRDYPHEVVRVATGMMLPVPSIRRQLHQLLADRKPDVVLFGATWPLAHMGPAMVRKHGVRYGGFTHGLELTGALVPGLLRHIGRHATLLTAVSSWARTRLEPAFGWSGGMQLLPSGVDTASFHPGVSDAAVRERHALGSAPVIACVSRLVARKGQDTLIKALPLVHREFPDARLLIVGGGPYDAALKRMASATPGGDRVTFAGAVPYADLPAYFRAGDVFAMPCRSRMMGLDIEALGAVFLQGSAVGRPIVVGNSGGAPEAVRDGGTGLLVDPEDPAAVASAILTLMGDPARALAMGEAGAKWVHGDWSWDATSARLRSMLDALA